jgi:hypothetical protein
LKGGEQMAEQKDPKGVKTESKPEYDLRILKEMKAVQAQNLTDGYMIGMYNGMEYCISLIEEREPEYVDVTEKLSK